MFMGHTLRMHHAPVRFFLLSAAAIFLASACTTQTSDPIDDEEDVGESYDAVTGRPKYTRRNTRLLGYWRGDDDCHGGFDMCTGALVERGADGQWSIVFGPYEYGSNLRLPLVNTDGVFVFTSGDNGPVEGHDDCDDPGCGNLEKIWGVIYPKKVGTKWVPTLKASFIFVFPYPDEEDAPEGEVRHTSYMTHE